MCPYWMSPRHRWKVYNESVKVSIKSGTGMQRSVPSQVPKCNAPGAHIFSGCDYFARHSGRPPHRKERDERTPDPVELRGLPLIHDEAVDEWGTQSPGPLHDRAIRPRKQLPKNKSKKPRRLTGGAFIHDVSQRTPDAVGSVALRLGRNGCTEDRQTNRSQDFGDGSTG
jgi:hypothetical protein